MKKNHYNNFVRPSLPDSVNTQATQPSLSGDEARRIYLEEIKKANNHTANRSISGNIAKKFTSKPKVDFTKKDLFVCVQDNDVQTLIQILDTCPNIINITDDYGWSLLMIACQANSVEAVGELLSRGIDIHVRDKAGNSAQSLVIKNRNLALADLLLNCKLKETVTVKSSKKEDLKNERFLCEICCKEFPEKEEHLSSTVHNINLSKDKKIPTKYVIPASNRGFQIMLKVGWDKESGLGPDGSGKKYPIKTVPKQDRKGLGLDKNKRKILEQRKDTVKIVNRNTLESSYRQSKSMEINFRRQFY